MGHLKDVVRPYVVTARRLARRDLRLTDIGYARKVSYSQFGEDLWLDEYFADTPEGFYVDVGAYDPFNASNTLLLYRRGWHGINIEPDPDSLARLRRYRQRDLNLGFAVSDTNGEATLLLAGSLSSLEAYRHRYTPTTSKRITVRTRRLEDVLADSIGTHDIDLLDVDCEGHDLVALESNDWQRFRPRIVLAEFHEDPPSDLESYMARVGYRRVASFILTYAFERQD